jgi:hypothetical protein
MNPSNDQTTEEGQMTDLQDKANYITLAEAAEHSPYSQEYLSLRARQGKLRAVKRGRNWYTTPGWLDDYLQQVDVARSDLRTVEVVEEAVPIADREPVRDPVLAVQPTRPSIIEEEPFVFHPTAKSRFDDSTDRSPVVGSVIADQESRPTGSKFSWDDDEPKQIAASPEPALLLASLQEKVDRAIAVDEPVIELDESELVAAGASNLGSGFVELGMKEDEPEMADTVSNTTPSSPSVSVEEISEEDQDKSSDLNWLVKPAITAAVILLVFVSNFSVFDKLFQVRRNVGAGFGVVTYSIGQRLVAYGEDRQDRREARLNKDNKIGLANFGLEASELVQGSNSKGTVAGATDTSDKHGFWETVALGLKVILGKK